MGDLEKTIVTSTGPFVIAFNFRAVKAGRLREYKIKRYDDTIVADNFRFGDDREIVRVLKQICQFRSFELKVPLH